MTAYRPDQQRIHVLRDMAPEEHVEEAYRLLSTPGPWEFEHVSATRAVAHLLLAQRKAN